MAVIHVRNKRDYTVIINVYSVWPKLLGLPLLTATACVR